MPSPPLLPGGHGGVADAVSSSGAGGREKRETGRAMPWRSLVYFVGEKRVSGVQTGGQRRKKKNEGIRLQVGPTLLDASRN
jgi:hypothetical protein